MLVTEIPVPAVRPFVLRVGADPVLTKDTAPPEDANVVVYDDDNVTAFVSDVITKLELPAVILLITSAGPVPSDTKVCEPPADASDVSGVDIVIALVAAVIVTFVPSVNPLML